MCDHTSAKHKDGKCQTCKEMWCINGSYNGCNDKECKFCRIVELISALKKQIHALKKQIRGENAPVAQSDRVTVS